jgi:hypothetical protein
MAGHNVNFHFPPILPSEIRLLSLRPSLYPGYPIICSLKTSLQSAAKNEYEALSYVWGMYEGVDLKPVTVNNRTYLITPNLHLALRHLRHERYDRVLWADAICLDQNNNEEKNRVVPEMHLIYGSARNVLAWVGEADTRTDIAIALAKELSKTSFELFEPALSTEQRQQYLADIIKYKRSKGYLPVADSVHWASLNLLFSHGWWDRVWILQEVVHAQKYELIWGSRNLLTVSGDDLAIAFELVRHLELHGLLSNSVIRSLLESLRKGRRLIEIERFRKNLRDHQPLSLEAALAASQERLATNALDHVYGCLSLAGTGPSRINVDYDNAILEVFEDATRALIDEGQSRCGGLNFLACCSLRQGDNDIKTPSWSVSFDSMNEHDAMCTPFGFDFRFAVAGKHSAVASCSPPQRLHQQPSVLRVQGMRFDEVQTLGDIRVSSLASESMQAFYKECESLLSQAYDSQPTARNHSTTEDLQRALICDWTIPDAEMPRGNGSWSPAYLRYAISSCSGRRFLLTRAGHMGLAPLATKLGDVVFLIAGCDVPLILRKTDAASSVSENDIGHQKCLQHGTALAGHIVIGNHERYYQIVGNACEYPYLEMYRL